MQTRGREDPVLPYPPVRRRHRLMRFYATTLFSLFQSDLILREIRLRRIFAMVQHTRNDIFQKMRRLMFSGYRPGSPCPSEIDLPFPERRPCPQPVRGNRFRRSRPVRSGRFCKKERDLPDKTRFSGTFTKTAKLFCAKTTKGKSRN